MALGIFWCYNKRGGGDSGVECIGVSDVAHSAMCRSVTHSEELSPVPTNLHTVH